MEIITLGRGDFTVTIWSLGASVNDIRMPDRTGRVASVVLGYGTEAARRAGRAYVGEICGPFANRIAAGGYEIDGHLYTPPLNDKSTATLHGGPGGWSFQDWDVAAADDDSVRLTLDWTDPQGQFPGPIAAEVTYRLDGWRLTHAVRATPAQPTVLNVVSHPYFNLSGGPGMIDDHELTVAAGSFLATDAALIPLPDAPWSVAGTPLDFRSARRIGEALATGHPQLVAPGGIDHALILDPTDGPAARLRHPATGRELAIFTDCPALQVYTGQYLDDAGITHPEGAGGARTGVALETEEYPDAPRRADFPSVVFRAGETYSRTTIWEFGITGQPRPADNK